MSPFLNEHSCRLVNPAKVNIVGSKNRTSTNGKVYRVLFGTNEEGGSIEQAYRYPKDDWSSMEARSHCDRHNGILFEPAISKEEFLKKNIELLLSKLEAEEGKGLEDWLYLVHHVHVADVTGNEKLHHCFMLDHLGNLYGIKHIKGKDGKIYHCLEGLKDNQEVFWSNEEAIAAGNTVPSANRQLES